MTAKKEKRYIVADFHMGEGHLIGGKLNNLELFNADMEFFHFVQLILREQEKDEELVLILLGDFIDFLRTSFRGRTHAEPTEDAAIEQIKKIFAAHPLVIHAMQTFLAGGGIIKFFVGNHDLALAWANVQNFIRSELTKGWAWHYDPDPLKCVWYDLMAFDRQIKFVFEEKKDGVFFIHGNDAEFVHATPKRVFFTKRKGRPLIPPLLRHQYGSHLITDQANVLSRGTRIFKGNKWVGRLEPHWFVFLEAIFKNRWFAFCAAILWFITPFRHRFSRRWWVRKSAGLWTLFRYNWASLVIAFYNKLRGRDYTEYAKSILAENEKIDVVFSGHFHDYARYTTKDGTIIYVGTWCTTYDAKFPEPEFKWKRWKGLEKIIRYFKIARQMFDPRMRHLFAPKRREVYSFGMCEFLGGGNKRVRLMRYNPEKDCLEEIN